MIVVMGTPKTKKNCLSRENFPEWKPALRRCYLFFNNIIRERSTTNLKNCSEQVELLLTRILLQAEPNE